MSRRPKQDFSDSEESDHKNFDDVKQQMQVQRQTQPKTPTRVQTRENELSSLAKSNKMDETKFENISDNRSAISQGYQAPSNVYLRSEGQVKLDIWLQRFKDDYICNHNLRAKNFNPDFYDENNQIGKPIPNTGYQAPCDAVGVPSIQTLDEYIKRAKRFNCNPRKTFFQLSSNYYTSRYKEDNRKTITVQSYIPLKNNDNFVRDLQLEIIQTSQGCMPIVKTYEYDVYSKKKFQKALKFYNYREEGVQDCPLLKQIVVDESVMHDNFWNWDCSILYFGNFIIFYKREFGNKRFKLHSYDVTTNDLQEIKGYEIEETQDLGSGTESRFHPIFSVEYGKVRNPSDVIRQQTDGSAGFDDFLKDKFCFLQNYSIHTDGTLLMDGVKMFRMKKDLTIAINSADNYKSNPDLLEVNSKTNPHSKITWAGNKRAEYFKREAIQYVCHQYNQKTGEYKFIAIDPFASHHFNLKGSVVSDVTTYIGNNEQQMFQQEEIKLWFEDKKENYPIYNEEDEYGDIPFKERYETRYRDYCPFFKHENPQYLIQKESIFMKDKQEYVDHYFNTTADNQYMLIYPNYQDQNIKKDVLFEIAQAHCYKSNPDEEYNYIDDYNTRRKDYLNSVYKRISHVCAEDWRSKNHMKRAEHIDDILQYSKQNGKKFNIYDKIILSTDQERSNIYVYQSSIVTGENKIEIYNYENNIAYAEKAKEVPIEIAYIMKDQELERDTNDKNILPHNCYYLNGRSQNVVSCSTQIRARMQSLKDQQTSDLVNHKIEHNDKNEFMIVETQNGLYKNIRIKQHHNEEKIRIEMYNIGKNGYTFFFSLVNDRHGNKKHNYFAIQKSFQEINDILGADNNHSLIQMETECHVFKANDLEGREKNVLKKYFEIMSFKGLLEYTKLQQNDWVHLTFEKIFDNAERLDFFPIISQQLKADRSTQFLLFDVNKMQIVRQTSVLINVETRKYLIKNSFGFAKYTITRTSNIFQDKKVGFNTKYQISVGCLLQDPGSTTQFNPFSKQENPAKCTVELQEFFIKFRYHGTNHIKLIGRKQMLLSQIAQLRRKDSFQDIYFFPFFDRNGDIKGCTLVLEQPPTAQQEVNVQQLNESRMSVSRASFKQKDASPGRASFTGSIRESFRKSVKTINKSQISQISEDDGMGWKEDPEDDFICINIKDQNVSNIYHQNSDLLQFGHQKFLINANTHEEFILLISSQFKQKVYCKGNFENAESNYVHRKVQKKLMSMQLAKFEYFVLNDDFEALLRQEFYQPQEVLEGKTINDLCLNFPKEVNYGLWQLDGQNAYGGNNQNDKTKWQSIEGSLAEEISESNPTRMDNLVELGLAEKNLIIQIDFNFCSSLRIAMALNANQTVKILMEKVFDINDRVYQELLMIDLPSFLTYPRIERLYPFLERDYEEASQIIKLQKAALGSGKKNLRDAFCNFEDSLNHPDLPEFYSQKITYHCVERYNDWENRDEEIVTDINHKHRMDSEEAPAVQFQDEDNSDKDEFNEGGFIDKLKFWKGKKINTFMDKDGKAHSCNFGDENEQLNIEVEHSCIDFTILIIGLKTKGVLEENQWNIQYNDEALADMLYIEDEEFVEFYNLDIVRKLIDYQFNEKTKPFLQFMFKFYVLGFVIPFILTMTIEWVLLLNILYSLCLFVQLFFISFEWIQLKQQHWEYFKDPFNVNDFSQFILFAFVYLYKMITQFEGDNLASMYLQAVIIIQCFYKSFYFMRIYDCYMFILNMSYHLVGMLIPFFVFIAFCFIALCKVQQSIGVGVHDEDHEYKDIPNHALRLMFQNYRSANGQKQVPFLNEKLQESLDNAPFFFFIMMFLVTVIWVFENTFFLYYITHFMAQLFHGYEENYPHMMMWAYKSKARFNSENFPVLQMFVRQKTFKTICFAVDKHQIVEIDNEYEGVVRMGQKWAIRREGQRLLKKKEDDAELEKLNSKQQLSLSHIEQLRKNNLESKKILDGLIEMAGSFYDRRCCCEQVGGVNYNR